MNEHSGNVWSLGTPNITILESGISVVIIVNMLDRCNRLDDCNLDAGFHYFNSFVCIH